MRISTQKVIISLLVFFSSIIQYSEACELKIRIMHYPPIAIKQLDNTWQGMDKDYSQLLLKHIKCSANYIEMPFSRGLRMLELGQIDMMLNMTKTAQREVLYYFIGPYRQETLSLITHKSIPDIKNWQQLINISGFIAIQRGVYYGKQFNNLLEKNKKFAEKLIYVAENQARIGLVIKERAIGFFEETSYLNYQIKNNPQFTDMKVHNIRIQTSPVYMAISKKTFDLHQAQKLQKSLEFLKSQNELINIEFKYQNSVMKNNKSTL